MNFLPLLGKRLKDDDIIDVLESAGIEVIYDFDRLHENTPDIYWATSEKDGFQLRFDSDQVLKVIFLYVMPSEGFAPVSQPGDVPFFSSIEQAEAHAAQRKVTVSKGKADFLGTKSEWVRLEYDDHHANYQFRGGELARASLTSKQ